ncbi:PilW family protein [Thiobacter aerophilum]|uniref:PilW family protein n=1 Tax=Thiobacter aerophilum TaxID=3121275 RepID=A0ABV0EIY8_9BURK
MKRDHGFGLVELLIGVAIALFLTAVIATVYVNSKGVWRNNAAVARLQEQARFALETMSRDIRMAGYRGCATDTTPVNTLNSSSSFFYDYTKVILGNDATAASWAPALDPAVSGLSPSPLAGRDVVTVWAAFDAGAQVTPPGMPSTSADIHVGAGNKLRQFDIVLAQDCAASAILQITNANPGTSGSVVHNTGLGTPGNSTKNLGHIFGPDATLLRLASITYYVAGSSIHPGINSLWRYTVPALTGAPQPEEIAVGVDNLQLEYGVDTDGDQVANVWQKAASVSDWTKVVAARINLLLVSPENNVTTSPQPYTFDGVVYVPADRRFRSTFSVAVNLRNRTP